MTKTGWISLFGLIAVFVGVLFIWRLAHAPSVSEAQEQTEEVTTSQNPPVDTEVPQTNAEAATTSPTTTPTEIKVTYDGKSFSPAQLTITQGTTVTFTDTAGSMWVAADAHPTHTHYDDTSKNEHCAAGYTGAKPFDQCTRGDTYSFTFDKLGTFEYHDHVNASAKGTITVVAAQ